MTTKIPVELSSTPGIVDNSDATAITIDSSENVGIGMTPFTGYTGYSLQIGGTSQTFISIHNTTTGNTVNDGFSLGNDASNVFLTNRENTPMIFSTNNAERMRIDSSGNLFLGTTSGTGKFNMDFSSIFGQVFKYTGSSTPFAVVFDHGSSTVGSITLTSSATSYNTSSDYRLKENVNYEFDALSRVTQLKPARFNFIADADKTVDGFIAHEVSDIVPEAITGEKDGEQMQGIDQSKLVPLLTKAIQEQQDIIDDLKSRIETLEG